MKKLELLNKLSLVFLGDVTGQVLRLFSNLILTRILVPEMFGLMAVVNSIITGLSLLTDVGLRGSVINEKQLDDNFFGTVWLTQIGRAVLIFITLIAISLPLEAFLEINDLAKVLVVLSFTTLISGLNSVNLLLFQRELKLLQLVIMQLSSQIIGIITMIIIAYYFRNIWSLVAGAFATTITTLLISHSLPGGEKPVIKFKLEIFMKLIHFGKWILVSTLGVYLTLHADKLIYSKYLSLTELGILTIAFGLGNIFSNLVSSISTKILQPLYSSSARNKNSDLFSLYKLRLLLISSALAGSLLISLLSEHIVSFLYDDRYINAGWMLKIISLGGFLYCLDVTLRPLLISNNDSFRSMKVQIIKSVLFVTGLIFGLHFFGLIGGLLSAAFLQLGGHYHLLKYVKIYGYKWYLTEVVLILISISIFSVSWYFESGIIYSQVLDYINSIPFNV